METGINEITESNWTEVYARMHLIEKMCGARRKQVPEKDAENQEPISVYLTPTEVKRWVGLYTNASPKTRIQFLRYFVYDLNDAVKYAEVCVKEAKDEVCSEIRPNND